MRLMLQEDWIGRVMVVESRRLVTETRLPTGEISSVLLTITVLPPRYGAPRRFWNLKFIAAKVFSGKCGDFRVFHRV